jgi:hypothetical protein
VPGPGELRRYVNAPSPVGPPGSRPGFFPLQVCISSYLSPPKKAISAKEVVISHGLTAQIRRLFLLCVVLAPPRPWWWLVLRHLARYSNPGLNFPHWPHCALPGWDAAAERRGAQGGFHSPAAQARAWADFVTGGDFDADHGLGLGGVGRSAYWSRACGEGWREEGGRACSLRALQLNLK